MVWKKGGSEGGTVTWREGGEVEGGDGRRVRE